MYPGMGHGQEKVKRGKLQLYEAEKEKLRCLGDLLDSISRLANFPTSSEERKPDNCQA